LFSSYMTTNLCHAHPDVIPDGRRRFAAEAFREYAHTYADVTPDGRRRSEEETILEYAQYSLDTALIEDHAEAGSQACSLCHTYVAPMDIGVSCPLSVCGVLLHRVCMNEGPRCDCLRHLELQITYRARVVQKVLHIEHVRCRVWQFHGCRMYGCCQFQCSRNLRFIELVTCAVAADSRSGNQGGSNRDFSQGDRSYRRSPV
jgi:hypothetical protein